MSALPLPPSGYRPPAVEDYDEDESTSDDGDAVDVSKTPANVGSKRSDPAIVKQKKYATSDSGYSSLTTTTASSSRSKTQGQASAAPESSSFKKKVANLIKKPAKDTRESKDPAPVPTTERRMSRKHDVSDLRLRSVESREEAGQMRRGAPVRMESQRSPAYTSGMPGAFPPSPTNATRPPLSAGVPIPRAVPRPRTNSTTYYYRPVSYGGSGSLPTGTYQVIQPQQQLQHQPVNVEHYRAMQPVYVNPPAQYPMPPDQFAGQAPYVPTPTSSSPGAAAGFGYGPASNQQQYYPPPPPPQTQPPSWAPGSYGYSSAAQPPAIPSRRTSMTASVDYNTMGMQYPPPPPQIHYAPPPNVGAEIQRRYSHTVGPSAEGIYRPPPMAPPPAPTPGPPVHPNQTPLDEGVFMEDYEDFYRMQMPPPPRPSSSHPTRPPMPHARTTSAAAVPPSHRRSLEYQPAISPRKQSFESRPPSRPGMMSRYSSNSTSSSRAQYGAMEPPSPVRRKHTNSVYGSADLEKITSAEAYQIAKTGPYQTNVTSKDLPPLARRTTRNSETSSRGSSSHGSDSKHNKRLSRHSTDKHRHSYDRERYTVNIGEGVSVNTQGGSLTIKHSRDGDGGMQLSFSGANNAGAGRPPSSVVKAPARESSRVRSGGTKYIEGSSSSSKSREKAEYEVSRRRRSSSMQPTVRAEDLTGPLKRLDLQRTRSRQSRSSSRSGRVYK